MLQHRSFPRFILLVSLASILLLSGCSAPKKPVKAAPPPPPPKAKTYSSSSTKYRENVTDYAQRFVGTSYKSGGKTPDTGFDCSGFTSYVLKQFNVPSSPSSSAVAKEGKPVDLNNVRPGDLIIFGKSKNNIQHVAMVVARKKDGIICVHSTTSRGVIVENVTASSYWKPLILFARDVIGTRPN